MQGLFEPLTLQDEAIFGYAKTLSDPWAEHPTGVPLVLGSGGVRTVKVQIRRRAEVQCNASGFGFLAVAMENWDEPGDGAGYNSQYVTYTGGVKGQDVWYSDSAYVGTVFPALNATSATTGVNSLEQPLLDDSLTTTTNYRQVACGIRGWSDAAYEAASGNVTFYSTSEPYAAVTLGGLTDASTSDLFAVSPYVLTQKTRAIPGWKSGEVMSTFAVPTGRNAFEFNNPVATGTTTFSYPSIGVAIEGGQSGQTFYVEIVKVFEFEFTQSFRVDVEPEPTLHVGPERVANVIRGMHPYKVSVARPANGPTPSTVHNGAGPLAFVKEIMQTRPGKLSHLQQIISRPQNMLKPVLASGVQWLAKNAMSFLPGVIGKAAKWLGF